MSRINQQLVLIKRPDGTPKVTDFDIIESPVPDIKDGEVLLRTHYFSLDPYMRGRMNESKSYIEPFKLGEVLENAAVCVVEESKTPELKVGEIFLSGTGCQKYTLQEYKVLESMLDQGSMRKLASDINPSYYLGALGMPGFTAYHGLMKIGEPKAGETVVVAAATGPVGSMVEQLAKIKGCRTVGIAGGAEKCRYAVEELGFDACIDHYSKKMAKEIEDACPEGIDVYYENVGGPVFSAILPLLNDFARIPVCGAISWYNDFGTLQQPGFTLHQIIPKIAAFSRMFLHLDKTPLILGSMIAKRLKYQGFIISDHYDEYEDFLHEVKPLIQSGKIKVKEDIVKGIENAPEAFIGLLSGKNFGKLIIEI